MHDKLTKARIKAIINQPFFGYFLMRMKLVKKDKEYFESSGFPPTMCTNGKELIYYQEFLDSLSPDDLYFVLIHEVCHVVFQSILRRQNRNPMLWNIASDFSINYHIKEIIKTLPSGLLYDKRFDNMAAEPIYDILEKELPPPKISEVFAEGFGGSVMDAPGSDNPSQQQQTEQEFRRLLVEAATFARSCGNIPGSIEKYVQDINDPVIPWHEILKSKILLSNTHKLNWKQPSKRYVHNNTYIPSTEKKKRAEVLIFWDTSGSVSKQETKNMASEVSSILSDLNANVTILYVDTKIQHVDNFTPEDLPIKFKLFGGGGTDFRPPFKWVEEQELSPKFAIYFTDLECSKFPPEPDYPVYWVNTSNNNNDKAPFGITIQLEGERNG